MLERYETLWAAVQERVGPSLVDLCSVRIAQVLDATDGPRASSSAPPEQLADIARWRTSPRFSEKEGACLKLAEQFAIDAHSVTDDDVEAVKAHLSADEVVALAFALALADGFIRAHRAWSRPLWLVRAGLHERS